MYSVTVLQSYVELVVAVVVQHKDSVQFTVRRHDQVRYVLHALRQRLPRILLHLNVEKLPVQHHIVKYNYNYTGTDLI